MKANLFPALLLAPVLHACTSRSATPADDAAIRDLARRYAAAFESEDVEAVLEVLTDDFVALSPAKPPLVGKDAVRPILAEDLAAMEIDRLRFTLEEIVVTGSWAYAWGTSEAAFRVGSDADTTHVRGKVLWILRRGDDGVWRVARDSAHAG